MKYLVVSLAVGIFAAFPVIFIWSLNTMFEFEIEYTLKTWLAAMFLGSLFVGRMSK